MGVPRPAAEPRRAAPQGLHLAKQIPPEVYFPTAGPAFEPARVDVPPDLAPFNRALNERQMLAVRNILECRGRPRPYLVYGPPGTGGCSPPRPPACTLR